ncbi:hypothetical protein GQ457_18G003820 [Hibiscus cannabinus]
MLDIWNLRLRHPSKQRMKFFSFLNKAIPATYNSECDTCHLAKHKRLPFSVSFSVSESVFDLLHMDVWGPFPVESLCVFIGHPKNMKGYRLFNLDTKEVFVSRDVVFCEQSFPFQKQVVLPVSDNNAGVDVFLHRNRMKNCCPGVSSGNASLNSTSDVLETGANFSSASQQQDVHPEQITDFQQHNNSAQPSDVHQNSNQKQSSDCLDVTHNTSSLPLEVLSDSIEVAARPTRVRHLPPKFRDYQVSLPKARTSPHSIAQVLSYNKLSASHSSYINNIDILPEPKNYKQAVLHDCWQTAMREEIEALERNHTWDLVSLPPGKQTIGCKWVYKTKLKSDGSLERYKARLVAKCYTQQPGVDYLDTFSPVAKMTSIKTLLAVASAKEWCLQQLDINNAFLHGYLQEEVYMQFPPGLTCSDSNVVCKLNKSLYGLKQASRKWNERLTSALLQQGFKQASSDSSFFIKGKGSDLVVLAVYVDDIILAGPNANVLK